MNRKLFAKRLEELRKTKRLSQEELGKYVGLSRFPVIDWEAGRKVPDVITASKMADLLGVTLDYLLGDTEGTDDTKRVTRCYEELPDGSLVPVRHPAHHCALDEILAENPDLEVWFRTQKLSEEAKEEIARLLLAIKNKWSAESASEAGDDLPALSLRAASSHACDKTDEEDEELHFRTK